MTFVDTDIDKMSGGTQWILQHVPTSPSRLWTNLNLGWPFKGSEKPRCLCINGAPIIMTSMSWEMRKHSKGLGVRFEM